ncbi:MAG: nitroreductase family deazaflavin-dependent oxidoreductase [Ardenticatenaceae bacterium]|nr:nitroreductase family deazaflavin-dependent oxidoreductase [Ardenticatenaceae bacterium]MCB9446636.1 nitroreductase family deazaflavin-dependent oxidoreductase [Ardenticatenaceae bacterium]
MKRIGSLRPVIWLLSHTLHHLDRLVLRWSNGRYATLTWFTGLPFLTLTTTGARSGQPHTVPLIGIPYNGQIILIASNWGKPRSLAWYYNLKAHPTVTVAVGGETAVYTAHEAHGTERETCWQEAVAYYPAYETYQKGNGRLIPVMVLTVGKNPDPSISLGFSR